MIAYFAMKQQVKDANLPLFHSKVYIGSKSTTKLSNLFDLTKITLY